MQRKKILVVDDKKEWRDVLKDLLAAKGWGDVMTAANGAEALKILGAHDVGLIISDILMPVMDGFQLCLAVKGDERLKDIPFVFFTATYTDQRDQDLALKVGADRFIRKPAKPAHFIREIRTLLEDIETGRVPPKDAHAADEKEVYKLYSERLVKKLEEKMLDLDKTQARLGHLLSSSPAFIYACRVTPDRGPGYPPTFVSNRIKDLFGYEPRECLDTAGWWAAGIHPEDRGNAFVSMERFFREGRLVREYRFQHKDGNYRWVHDELNLIRDEGGRPVEFVGSWMDITSVKEAEEEREKLQEQLRQSQKLEAVGRLTGGIAHDFNNLLTPIIGNSEMALSDMGKEDPLYEVMEEIRNAGARAASLTRQLLAFSRKQILHPEVVDLNEVVGDMDRILRRLIGEDIEIRTILDPGLGEVKVDPNQIEQVLMNLAVNARDAMPKGGKLTIETRNVELDEAYARNHITVIAGPYVMLAVSDTGAGMSKEVQDQLFEPFFTTKEKGKGTGLGLSTVYGIIKQSKGNIWVYSEPGKGSTFKIYLPRLEEMGDVTEKPDKKEESLQGSETVLVVEDDEMVRNMVLKALKRYGYKVLCAANGQEALRISREHKGSINLMLTDVVMPGMSGRELAEGLKGQRPGMRVLFMSGYTDDSIVHHGVLEEGIAFIQKPFTPEGLARKVREVLGENDE